MPRLGNVTGSVGILKDMHRRCLAGAFAAAATCAGSAANMPFTSTATDSAMVVRLRI